MKWEPLAYIVAKGTHEMIMVKYETVGKLVFKLLICLSSVIYICYVWYEQLPFLMGIVVLFIVN